MLAISRMLAGRRRGSGTCERGGYIHIYIYI